MWQLASGAYLGWALGANDASNVFGTAVASRMLKFWTAALLCCIFLFLGAVLGGAERPSVLDDESFAAALKALQGSPAAFGVTFTGPMLEAFGGMLLEGLEELRDMGMPMGFEQVIGLLSNAGERFGGTLTSAVTYRGGLFKMQLVGR